MENVLAYILALGIVYINIGACVIILLEKGKFICINHSRLLYASIFPYVLGKVLYLNLSGKVTKETRLSMYGFLTDNKE